MNSKKHVDDFDECSVNTVYSSSKSKCIKSPLVNAFAGSHKISGAAFIFLFDQC